MPGTTSNEGGTNGTGGTPNPTTTNDQQQGGSGGESQDNQPQQPLVFDEWVKGQDATIKTMIDDHVKGLRTALNAERDRGKTLEKQLRDAAAKVEKGSDTEKQLTQLAAELEDMRKQQSFYEVAPKEGVSNPRLAWTVAKADNLFTRAGDVDFRALKEAYPELFAQPQKPQQSAGNAGSGTQRGGAQNTGSNMNDLIRRAAGRT